MTILTTLCALEVLVEAFRTTPSIHVVMNVDGTTTGTVQNLSNLQRLGKAVLSEKLTFLFGSFTLLCAWSLTSLLCFHGMIISVAQTTNERVRGVYRFGQVDNHADRGCCLNWYTAACSPCAVSRLPINMSAQVISDYENRPEKVWNGEDEEGGGGGGVNNTTSNAAVAAVETVVAAAKMIPVAAHAGLNGNNSNDDASKEEFSIASSNDDSSNDEPDTQTPSTTHNDDDKTMMGTTTGEEDEEEEKIVEALV